MSTAFQNRPPEHLVGSGTSPPTPAPDFAPSKGNEPDPRIAHAQLAVLDPETPWAERVAALETYSRANFTHEAPGVPVSPERLAFEATALGLEFRRHEQCFRLDTRPPDIIFAEGFMPRSDKPSGALLSHLESKSGNMVSGTAEEANSTVVWGLVVHNKLAAVGENQVTAFNAKLAAQFETDVARFKELVPDASPWDFSMMGSQDFFPGNVDAGISKFQKIAQLFEKLPPEMRVVPPEIADGLAKTPEDFIERAYNAWGGPLGELPQVVQEYTVYEYRVRDIEGVEFLADFQDFSFQDQREVTFSHATPEQIDAVRELKVRATYVGFFHGSGLTLDIGNLEIEAGDWVAPEKE